MKKMNKYILLVKFLDEISLDSGYPKTEEISVEADTYEQAVQDFKEEYKNISVQALKAFFKKKEKSFYSLEEYGGKYDFNNREMTNNAVGPKPEQSDFDGSVKIVEEYIKSNAKDKNSIKYLEWSKVIPSDEFWVVRCKYEGNNSFGAKTTENTWFYIKNSKVVKMK